MCISIDKFTGSSSKGAKYEEEVGFMGNQKIQELSGAAARTGKLKKKAGNNVNNKNNGGSLQTETITKTMILIKIQMKTDIGNMW